MTVDISKNSKTTGLIHFGQMLEQYNVSYHQSGIFLQVGEIGEVNPFTLFLSIRVLRAEELLLKIIPILKNHTVPYEFLRDNYTVNKANGYGFGLEGVGKFLTLYPRTEAELVEVVVKLNSVTSEFRGPEIIGAIRLGEIIYKKGLQGTTSLHSTVSKYSPPKRKRIIGRYYVPVQLLRSLPKGDTLKCINVRRFSFSWCLIKQGNRNAFDDFSGRDMIDRIHWQHHVLRDIEKLGIAPKVIDIFHDDHSANLVLQYIEGYSLQQKVIELRREKEWKSLDKLIKIEILEYYLRIIEIVGSLHEHNYIHRDINDENFIVAKDKKVYILDFELAYSTQADSPDPPFNLGTFGYMSPQQHYFEPPNFSDDIYSLGAVLIFILTGTSPNATINISSDAKMSMLYYLSYDDILNDIAIQCLDDEPANRPTLIELKQIVLEVLDQQLTYTLTD